MKSNILSANFVNTAALMPMILRDISWQFIQKTKVIGFYCAYLLKKFEIVANSGWQKVSNSWGAYIIHSALEMWMVGKKLSAMLTK